MDTSAYGLKTTTEKPVSEAEHTVREALGEEGFGVLTEIDVAETLRVKLGVERGPYRILGACNPELANDALNAEADIGLLLPCNVVVYAEGDRTIVAAVDPETIVETTGNNDLANIAADARQRLERVIAAVSSDR